MWWVNIHFSVRMEIHNYIYMSRKSTKKKKNLYLFWQIAQYVKYQIQINIFAYYVANTFEIMFTRY